MRLIDLHVDWLLQYAVESTTFDPTFYAGIPQRLGQAEGYLHGTSAAIVACYRNPEEWARQADPWASLGALVARVEAEFCGRLLADPEDLRRWQEEADGLCWGLIGVEGFDALVRAPSDLDRLPRLFERGVRLFQPVYSARNALGGASVPGDDRGLTDLGLAFLNVLSDLGTGPVHPLLDLAHLNPRTVSDVLTWFEAEPERSRRVVPVYSHGAPCHEGFATPRALTLDHLGRLRALGGVVGFSVGPPFFASAEQLRCSLETAASIPFEGRAGFEGLAIGTDFLGVNQTLPGLGNVEGLLAWIATTFGSEPAAALASGNARRLLEYACGGAA